MNTEVSFHSETQEVDVVLDELTMKSNDSILCDANAANKTRVNNVDDTSVSRDVVVAEARKSAPLLQDCAYRQMLPSDFARDMSSNGYSLPRLQLM